MATQDPKLKLVPVLAADYPAIARLQCDAYGDSEFGEVAFGPNRSSEHAVSLLTANIAGVAAAPKPGYTVRDMKLVRVGPTGDEEIIGFAGWTICIGRTGSEEEKRRLGTREAWAVQDENSADEPFGPYGDVKFCTDVFVRADEHMSRATGGNDYASEFLLR